uniref:Uncharacterized protein n=1 Tax=Thermorudis sp. TaxID=1969470 RepID=A0A7C3ARA5_9BACT
MNTAHRDPFDLHEAIHEMRRQLGTELLLRLLLYAVGAGLVAAALTRSLASDGAASRRFSSARISSIAAQL